MPSPLDMNEKKVRPAILLEWLILVHGQRASLNHAAQFADQAIRVRGMRADEVSVAMTKVWLERRTGFKPFF